MDYEKKYKEALDRARIYRDNAKAVEEYSAVARYENIFPELRESEDERIRKELISFFKDGISTTVAKKDIVSWLEKQKEHPKSAVEVLARAGLKPYKDGNQWCILAGDNIQEGICGFGDTIDEALYQFLMEILEKQKDASKAIDAVERIDKYIDEHVANAHDMKDSNPDKKYYRGWDDALGKMAGILQDVYSNEKQKEQKPDDLSLDKLVEFFEKTAKQYDINLPHRGYDIYHLCKDLYNFIYTFLPIPEQKPAEWSEEDERMVLFYEADYNNKVGNMPMKDVIEMRMKFKDWLSNRLKSLRPQPQGVFEQAVHDILKMCDDYQSKGAFAEDRARDFWGNVRVKCKDAIECSPILDEPHWKPSEEQMDNLLRVASALDAMHYKNESKVLVEFYNNLKS